MDYQEYHRLRRFFAARVSEQDKERPGYSAEWELLRASILGTSRGLIVPPTTVESSIVRIREHGKIWPCRAVLEAGAQNECHKNVADQWFAGTLDGIGEGYALSDELWRQHSWGFRNSGNEQIIVETTVISLSYFGVQRRGNDADRFAAAQIQLAEALLKEQASLP